MRSFILNVHHSLPGLGFWKNKDFQYQEGNKNFQGFETSDLSKSIYLTAFTHWIEKKESFKINTRGMNNAFETLCIRVQHLILFFFFVDRV